MAGKLTIVSSTFGLSIWAWAGPSSWTQLMLVIVPGGSGFPSSLIVEVSGTVSPSATVSSGRATTVGGSLLGPGLKSPSVNS
jgi:hypothetical protein